MAETAGYSDLEILPSFRGFRQRLEQGANADLVAAGRSGGRKYGEAAGDQAGRGFKGRFSGALRGYAPLAGLAAGAGIVSIFKGVVDEASSVAEAGSKVNVVFGEMANEVRAFGESASESFGQSDRQALSALGTFGNLLRAVGLTEEQSAKFSTTMVKLASDLASFNDTSVDDALDALRSGLVGETEPLKRFGVNLNEARLKQEALSQGLADGKAPLDANAKAQAAFALIMKDTALAQGDFARTQDGLANSSRDLTADLADMRSELGEKLLPAATELVQILRDQGIPTLEAAGGVAADAGRAFGSLPDPVKAAAAALVALKLASAAGIGNALSASFEEAGSAADSARLRVMFARDEYVAMRAGADGAAASNGRLAASFAAVRVGASGAGTAVTRGLRGALNLVGGPWGAAFIAGAGILTHFWQEHEEAKARVKALTDSLDKQTGALTANSRELILNDLQRSGVLDSAEKLGLNLKDVTEAAFGNAAALARLNAEASRKAALDKANLGGTLDTINADVARSQSIQAVIAGTQQFSSALEDERRLIDQRVRAGSQQESVNGQVATSYRDVAEGAQTARAEVLKLLTAENKRRESSLQDRRDRIALLDTFAATRKEANEGKKTLDENTNAGRENMSALLDLADQWNNSTSKVKNAKGAYEEMRQAFIDLADQMNGPKGTRREARLLADELLGLPKRKAIRVETPGMKQALEETRRLKDLASQLGTIGFNVTRRHRLGGGNDAFASGGKVGGHGTGDTRLIWADPREWVIKPQAVDHYGDAFMSALNNLQVPKRGMAQGGSVGSAPRASIQGGNNFNGPITVVAADPDEFLRKLQTRVSRRAIGGIPIRRP